MNKLKTITLALLLSGVSTLWAQDLAPTKLGKWSKPAATGIEKVDTYVNHCAAMYDETIAIRKQYDSIEALTLNVGEALAVAESDGDVVKQKTAQYKALLDRITRQQAQGEKLPAMAEAAGKAVPIGLKAVAATKSIASTKDAIKLAVTENADLAKAITMKIKALGTAPTKAAQ